MKCEKHKKYWQPFAFLSDSCFHVQARDLRRLSEILYMQMATEELLFFDGMALHSIHHRLGEGANVPLEDPPAFNPSKSFGASPTCNTGLVLNTTN